MSLRRENLNVQVQVERGRKGERERERDKAPPGAISGYRMKLNTQKQRYQKRRKPWRAATNKTGNFSETSAGKVKMRFHRIVTVFEINRYTFSRKISRELYYGSISFLARLFDPIPFKSTQI